jgi:RHS repeat-associated protein
MSTDAVGNFPVDPESGDFWHTFADISVNGFGPGLDLSRTYNSMNASNNGMFGFGWTAYSSYSPTANAITMPDGSTIQLGSGYSLPSYAAANTSFATSGSGYKFVFQGTTTYNYNSSGGLTSMVDSNGATTSFSYNGSGQLTTITDAASRTITFTYNSSGQVATATDPLSRVWHYYYTAFGSGEDLTSVSDPLSRVTSFTYDPTSNLLLTLELPNGQPGGPNAGAEVTNTYNSYGQIATQTDQMGNKTTYTYSGGNASNNNSSSGGSTIVTDPDGNETEYNYVSGTLTSKVEGYGTSSPSTWSYTYSAPTLGVWQTTDPNSNVTTDTYDSDGNLITSTNALGNEWTYSYNSFDEQICANEPLQASPCSSLSPPAAITAGTATITPPSSAPPAFVTYSEYDTDGNLIYTTTGDYAPGSGTPSQSRTTYKLYNGQSVTLGSTTDSCSATAPSTELPCATINADGVVTQLNYDSYGDLTSKFTPYEYQSQIPGTTFTFAGGPVGPFTATTVFQGAVQLANATVGGVSYVYVADGHNNVIRSINDSSDQESVVAGNYAAGSYGNGGAATSAQVANPNGIAVDSSGDMAIADTGSNKIRFVPVATGTYFGQAMTAGDIYTIAGNGTAGFSGNGAAAISAELSSPGAVAFDSGGVVVADTGNNEVRFIPATSGTYFGQSMTADDIYDVAGNSTAGFSGNGGVATSAKLHSPTSVAVDGGGDVAIADESNNEVRFVAATTGTFYGQSMTDGDIYDVAGNNTAGFSGNGGIATSAELNSPSGVTFDTSGDIVIADTNNHVVRFVPKSTNTYYGTSMTANYIYGIAGNGTSGTSGNGGSATSAELGTPVGLAVDSSGDVFIADLSNDEIRVVVGTSVSLINQSVTAGDIYLAAGTGAGTEQISNGTAFNSELNAPSSVRSDSAGNVIIADTADNAIRFVPFANGTFFGVSMTAANIYTIAGTGVAGYTGNAGPAVSAELSSPSGVAVSATDNVAIADTANNVVRFIPATSGTFFGVSMTADDIYTIAGTGTAGYTGNGGSATAAELSGPDGVSFDSAGDLVIADSANHVIRFVPIVSGTHYGIAMTADDIYTIAGNHTAGYSGNGGAATSAELSEPNDVQLDSAGDLLIPDTENNVVRFVPVANGTNFGASRTADDIYTIAGNGTAGYSGNDGAATSAEFNNVMDATFDSSGDVLIADTGNDYVRFLPVTTGEFYGQLMTADDVYSIAGEGTSNPNYGGDHNAPLQAEFGKPSSISYDGAEGYFLADPLDQRVRHISMTLLYYGATTTYTYDSDGELTSEATANSTAQAVTAANYTTVFTYDNDGEVTVAEQGGGTGHTVVARYTYYGYDGDGNETSMKDPLGYTYTYTFNADDEKTLSTNPLGDATLTCYDGDGNVAETVPPVGVAASSLTPASCPTLYPAGYSSSPLASDASMTTYDALNEPTVLTTPAPPGLTGFETTTKAYDLGGRLTSVTAPTTTVGGTTNDVTDYTHNAANELVATSTGVGASSTEATASRCYDPDGNVTATVPGQGNPYNSYAACSTNSPYTTSSTYQTTYAYDSLGELLTQTAPTTAAAPSGQVTTYAYDPAGNQISLVTPDGITATKTYTPLNLLASVSYSNGTTGDTYSYDAENDQIGMTDASGTTTSAFDFYQEQTSTTNGAGLTIGHAYDLDGYVYRVTYSLSGASWASTPTIVYQYDHADDITLVTDFNSNISRIGYTADGLPTTLRFGGSGPTVTTTYAANDAPASITLGNGSTLQEFAYSDAPDGNIVSETDTPTSSLSPAGYTYDPQERVTGDTPGTSGAKLYTEDRSSDLTTLPTGASGSYYGSSAELSSSVLSSTTTNYSYDASGNRTAKSGGSTVSATYNGDNELTSYDNAAANMSSATYNGNGLRTSATTGASTQQFSWDTSSSSPELLQDSTNAYIYGPFGVPFEQVNLSTGTIQYLVGDALGSVRGVVSSSGALTATTSYDAWGNPETTGGLSAYTPFGFAGGYTDSTGLSYFVNRYYDPKTGDFVNVDPDVTTTAMAYSYAGDDPVDVNDPLGEDPQLLGNPKQNPDQTVPGGTVVTITKTTTDTTTKDSSAPIASSPYSGWPRIQGSGPTLTILIGPVLYVVTTSITVWGPNSNPHVTIDSGGNLTLSGAAGTSATFSWWNSSLEFGGVSLTSSQTSTFGDGDKATVSFTLTPKTYPGGGWADDALIVFDGALLVSPAVLTFGGEVVVVGGLGAH